MKDILRAAVAVPALKVADISYNKNAILERMKEAHEAGAALLVTPELSLTGATCGDLFFSDLLLEQTLIALHRLAEASPKDMLTLVGAPIKASGRVYNCACLIGDGDIQAIVAKCHLTVAEQRYFASGADIAEGGVYTADGIPLYGTLNFETADGTTLSIAIGRDLSDKQTDAEVILNPAAGNAMVGAGERRRRAVLEQSARDMAACLSVNAGEQESASDLIYSGHGMIAMNGKLIAENKNYTDSDYMMISDLDLGTIRYDRRKAPACDRTEALCLPVSLPASDGALLKIRRLPFIPDEKKARTERCMEIFEMQAAALSRRLSITGGKLTLGISGGLDSTLALLVAIRAMEKLKLPRTNITAVTMPCFGTSDETLANALTLMQNLGVTSRTVSIKEAVLQHFKDIGHDPTDYSVTYENAQARERTQVLMDIANQVGGIVLGTGDLSEMALGWCTYNGDHMSMYGVNADVPKTLVRWIVTSIAESDLLPEASEVLLRVVDTPISPELLPPDAVGKIAQKTEDIVGPYALHDFFLYWAVRYQYTPSKIFALAQKAFDGIFDGATIKKWLTVFWRRFFNQQFKRNCVPDGVKVGSVGLSPRGDWQMPSDASCALWLAEIETIEP
ncbi:MAG: NAD(+) synthase [Clostridia bacterium]|nr:NAD(+) synthase [Clostridia bacterium]